MEDKAGENKRKEVFKVGLADNIQTLEVQYDSDPSPSKGQELAEAIAEMIVRKNSKGLIQAWFNDLSVLMDKLDRRDELNAAAGGIKISHLGPWDVQAAVDSWLKKQYAPIPAQK